MIKNRSDLKYYLECDKKALGITWKRPRLFRDSIWRFQILYRKTEYWVNNQKKSPFHKLMALLYQLHYKRECRKRCSEIPINCIAEGLCIWHGFNIVINDQVRIGKNFGLSSSVNIGQAHGKAPVIGDNVTMTYGSSVIGGVHIANNVTIGSRALVLKDINEEFVTVGGIPAKILSHKDPTHPMIRG